MDLRNKSFGTGALARITRHRPESWTHLSSVCSSINLNDGCSSSYNASTAYLVSVAFGANNSIETTCWQMASTEVMKDSEVMEEVMEEIVFRRSDESTLSSHEE
ncbi:unnamed protein product [Peronospora effusa]|nr:unnamed protein product [Peronospora effusa]